MPSDASILPVAEATVARPFWRLYDALAADIPESLRIEAFSAGRAWFGVRAGGGLGLAMSPPECSPSPSRAGRVAGSPACEIAPLAKSWNLADAALGVAAINAFHNHPERVHEWLNREGGLVHAVNAFDYFLPQLSGRRVAVIGHFRNLERVAAVCELSILERKPQPGDVPDPACELILPECDWVFITATTLINKTLPRLLELSHGAKVVLVGPTTPLTSAWFDLGVHAVAGLCIDDTAAVWRIVQEGGRHEFFESGTRYALVERE